MSSLRVLRWVALSVSLSLVLGFSGGTAFAQTSEQKRAAKEHFEQARRLYDVGRYPEAIEAYQRAYLNVEDPVFLFNIAQSYRLNDQPEEAIRFYRNYLRRSPEAANRADVEKRIADLQNDLDNKSAEQQQPQSPPPLEPTPPVVVAPRPRRPAPVEPPPATRSPVHSVPNSTLPQRKTAHPWRTTGIVLAGVGGGLLVTAVITGSMANKAATDLEKATVFDPAIEKRGQALNGVAIATGVLGLLAGVAGGVLLLLDAGGSSSTADVAAQPRLALTPVVSSAYAGARASLKF